jgi:hypothetical protein
MNQQACFVLTESVQTASHWYLGLLERTCCGTLQSLTFWLSHTFLQRRHLLAVQAEIAALRKEDKYASAIANYTFVPIALETLGAIGTKATSFLRELGRRLSLATDDPRETAFLFQRLSVALQQYNAVCFRGSFPETPAAH